MQNLLAPPSEAIVHEITRLMRVVERVAPVPSGHRRDIPFAIRDLSSLLTDDRKNLTRSYWSHPRFVSAYVNYFLPWNLYRLAWLLPGLQIDLSRGDTVIDLGAGPLTLPLALWCARKDLRDIPLNFLCIDVSSQPMETGKKLFSALAGAESPWRFTLARSPLEAGLAKAGEASLILSGNVLNEVTSARGQSPEDRVKEIAGLCLSKLKTGGTLLCVEPGTRLGARMVSVVRESVLRNGAQVLAPCPHAAPCPMYAQKEYYALSPNFSGWCHFICPAKGAPSRLLDMTEKARLTKQSLAISCLYVQKQETVLDKRGQSCGAKHPPSNMIELDELEAIFAESMADEVDYSLPDEGPQAFSGAVHETKEQESFAHSPAQQKEEWEAYLDALPDPMPACVISDIIRLPEEEPGRYACTAKGLGLLLDAVRVPSGAGCMVTQDQKQERDAKTGALRVMLVKRAGQANAAKGGMVRETRATVDASSERDFSEKKDKRSATAVRGTVEKRTTLKEHAKPRKAPQKHKA